MSQRMTPYQKRINQQISILNTQARGRVARFILGPRYLRTAAQRRKPDPPIGEPHKNITVDEWMDLCARYGNACLRCKRSGILLVPDHIVPISKGGLHHINNIQPLCKRCNSHKCGRVIDYRPEYSSAFTSQVAVTIKRPDGSVMWHCEYDTILSPQVLEILSRGREKKKCY